MLRGTEDQFPSSERALSRFIQPLRPANRLVGPFPHSLTLSSLSRCFVFQFPPVRSTFYRQFRLSVQSRFNDFVLPLAQAALFLGPIVPLLVFLLSIPSIPFPELDERGLLAVFSPAAEVSSFSDCPARSKSSLVPIPSFLRTSALGCASLAATISKFPFGFYSSLSIGPISLALHP